MTRRVNFEQLFCKGRRRGDLRGSSRTTMNVSHTPHSSEVDDTVTQQHAGRPDNGGWGGGGVEGEIYIYSGTPRTP